MRYIIVPFLCVLYINVHSQNQDHVWVVGYAGGEFPDSINIINKEWGNTNFDFNYDPVLIEYDTSNENNIFETNTNICDATGTLLAYSNGARIWNRFHDYIEDTINYGEYWEVRKNTGMSTMQSMIMLPSPSYNNEFYAFYTQYDNKIPTKYGPLMYTSIKMDENGVDGIVLSKDKILYDNNLFENVTACRHGNGRDWWIVISHRLSNKFYAFLLSPDGISDRVESTLSNVNFQVTLGQLFFSPDGKKLMLNGIRQFGNNGAKIQIMDFDRCTGRISNPKLDFMNASSISYGVGFSNDSRYGYCSNDSLLVQYDLQAEDVIASKKVVAIWDGFQISNVTFVSLGFMTQGPDGRVYITAGSASNKYFSTIEYPEEGDTLCEVRQHSVKLSSWYGRTAPNFPNYRLGPLDGSSCDTLGLDNSPIAKYRYEGDTLDHLKVRFTDLSYFRPETWHWDFDDGTTFDGKKPYWHTFLKNGVYNVCLTVSNENSENTTCRLVTIGTNSIDNDPSKLNKEIVSLFPNPTDGEVLLTLSDYIPEHGVVEIYDLTGKLKLSSRIFYGWNNLDLSQLNGGTYVYLFKDGSTTLSSGKIVKI